VQRVSSNRYDHLSRWIAVTFSEKICNAASFIYGRMGASDSDKIDFQISPIEFVPGADELRDSDRLMFGIC
jgi:hypothetical protein